MSNLRQKVEDAAIQMGLGQQAASDLADELIGNKYEIKIRLSCLG
jgi:hypothetical protein